MNLLEKGAICAGEAREKSLPIRGGGREAGRKGSGRYRVGSPFPCKRPRVLHKFPGGGGERCPRQARQTNRALGGGL